MEEGKFSNCDEVKNYLRNKLKHPVWHDRIHLYTRDITTIIHADLVLACLSSLGQVMNMEIDYAGTAEYPDLITIKLTQK